MSLPKESLLVFLWCCAYLLSLSHMIVFFRYSRLWLLRVWNGVLQDIQEKWGTRIKLNKQMMTPKRIEEYIIAIGSSLSDKLIFGFINSIEVYIYRPGEEDQQSFYSGHYKQYLLGYMVIVLPNGLFGVIFTGLLFASGDATLYIQIGLSTKLKDLLSYLLDGKA